MKRIGYWRIAIVACMLALACGLLPACGSPSGINAAQDDKQANRAYMSQVNEIMDAVSVDLDAFVEAVSTGDPVAMRMQADTAIKDLDKLSGIDVPDDLKDVQDSYKDGSDKLGEALDQYVTLYAELQNGSIDQASFADRLSQVQSLYDEGVDALKKGDETASEL